MLSEEIIKVGFTERKLPAGTHICMIFLDETERRRIIGKFIVDEMLGRLKAFYEEAIEKGYSHTRVSGEMSWALRGIPGSDRLMEYEAWVNVVLQTHPISAICQYDANKFSGSLILDALKVHPMMIVRGQIIHNPYFLSPDVFLEEFNKRSENIISE